MEDAEFYGKIQAVSEQNARIEKLDSVRVPLFRAFCVHRPQSLAIADSACTEAAPNIPQCICVFQNAKLSLNEVGGREEGHCHHHCVLRIRLGRQNQ